MSANALREELARAVSVHVDDDSRDGWQYWLPEIDAVLDALHAHLAEPTPAMLAALAREKKLLGPHLTVGQAWRAMLEAGLE